jgi:hypothetical protein
MKRFISYINIDISAVVKSNMCFLFLSRRQEWVLDAKRDKNISICLSMALQPFVGPSSPFQFLDFTLSVWRGISQSQSRYLQTEQHKQVCVLSIQWLRMALSKGPNRPSPEDGNRSSFRNVVFLVISNPDDGQSPKTQYLCLLSKFNEVL